MRLIISLILAAMMVSCVSPPARSQSTYTVVATCGTPPATFSAGAVRTGTMDTSGQICSVAPAGTGSATAANQVLQLAQETATNTVLGTVTASPTANTIADRLKVINTTLGSPFQAGGSIGNTSFAVTNAGTFATQSVVTNAGTFATQSVVTNAGTFATQSAITAASGSYASGSQPVGITPTDHTITSATGSSQTVANALATRKSLLIVNTGNANCGINPTGGTAVIGGAGTITLTPTGSYSPRIPTLAAVTAICTAGQPLYAEES